MEPHIGCKAGKLKPLQALRKLAAAVAIHQRPNHPVLPYFFNQETRRMLSKGDCIPHILAF
jgi:hypothetical protein